MAVREGLWWVGAVLVAVSVVLVGLAVAGVLVVSAGVVVHPGWWGVGLAVAGLVLALASAVRRPRGAGAAPSRGPRPASVVLALAALGAAGVTVLFFVRVDHTTLTPTSDDGCRVVVGESSFLFSGSGTVHVVGSDWGLARQVGRYSGDDGYLPVAAGSASLSWEGSRGVLTLAGNGVDPVDPGSFEVTCDR